MPSFIALEDGTVFTGEPFGARGVTTGEVCFNTGMTGYQEVLTDPSYCGQIVTMTAPQIGNTGVNSEDPESDRLWLAGFIVRSASAITSSWRAEQGLHEYLKEHGVVGLTEVDTRALTRHIRDNGAQRAAISTDDHSADELIALAQASPKMSGRDLATEVTCPEAYQWTAGAGGWGSTSSALPSDSEFHVVAYDFGMKHNILRLLVEHNCKVSVVPANTSAEDVLALQPDGIFLSNGPGDPAAVQYAVDAVKDLLGRIPIFGICLGHQILALALGGETYKLKFGHRGGNQPVKNLLTDKVEISTHNHGFAVRAENLPEGVEMTHRNLNDDCVEGLRANHLRAFSVQYHPEAAPGPHDSRYLFREFVGLMKAGPNREAI